LLDNFPRVRLAQLPTPLEHLPRLSAHLSGPQIWVKRDDCTGLATGGNKARKLEFALAAALAEGADTIVTAGAPQSNHVRQTAAAACKLGLVCEVLLEHHEAALQLACADSGNVLLDRLFGARLHPQVAGADLNAAMQALAQELRASGQKPYVIPVGASNALGALGYVNCAFELQQQAAQQHLSLQQLVTATGSGGTQAGLVVGLRARQAEMSVLGIGVSSAQRAQEQKVFSIARDTAVLLGQPEVVARDDIVANCDYVGPGYGVATDAMKEAVLLLARLEGMLFDPVYSGKALAGMIDLIDRREIDRTANIVFLHTGGVPALFAYAGEFEA